MHISNGGVSLSLYEEDGLLGVEAETSQFGLRAAKAFIPLLWCENKYHHHFERHPQPSVFVPKNPNNNSNNDTLFNWLYAELTEIKQWLDANPTKSLSDFMMIHKLKQK